MNCQKCRQPLKLDGSLEDLNPAAYDLLISSSSSASPRSTPSPKTVGQQQTDAKARAAVYQKASIGSSQPVFKRQHGAQPRDSAMSFIYLTESQVGHPTQTQHPAAKEPSTPTKTGRSASNRNGSKQAEGPPKSDDMDRINRLFEILSARSDIDHPICVDCTEMLVDGLQSKMDAAAKDRDMYIQHLKQLQAGRPTDADIEAQREATKKAENDRAAAMEELKRLEKEKDALDEEILALEEESRELDKEEDAFWRERNAFASRLADFQMDRDSVNVKFNNDSALLDKLQRTNVYNDTFCISHDGSFATINGLRLGRLSNKPVDWPEINAAWGHALLLVVTVADKLQYKFRGYDVQPMGSTSKIIRYETPSPSSSRLGARAAADLTHGPTRPPPPPKKHVLELYSSGDMPLGLTFMHRKFDNAMVAFLDLVRQLGTFVYEETKANGRPLGLPYSIEGDKIGDVSIKLGIAQDDGWTKACKYALTCCKFLLAHASNVGASKESNST